MILSPDNKYKGTYLDTSGRSEAILINLMSGGRMRKPKYMVNAYSLKYEVHLLNLLVLS